MRLRKINKMKLTHKVLLVTLFLLFFTGVAYLPYVNLLFPLWFKIIIMWFLILALFPFPILLQGVMLITFWLAACFLSLTANEMIAENITISIYFIFFYIVIRSFFKEAKYKN